MQLPDAKALLSDELAPSCRDEAPVEPLALGLEQHIPQEPPDVPTRPDAQLSWDRLRLSGLGPTGPRSVDAASVLSLASSIGDEHGFARWSMAAAAAAQAGQGLEPKTEPFAEAADLVPPFLPVSPCPSVSLMPLGVTGDVALSGVADPRMRLDRPLSRTLSVPPGEDVSGWLERFGPGEWLLSLDSPAVVPLAPTAFPEPLAVAPRAEAAPCKAEPPATQAPARDPDGDGDAAVEAFRRGKYAPGPDGLRRAVLGRVGLEDAPMPAMSPEDTPKQRLVYRGPRVTAFVKKPLPELEGAAGVVEKLFQAARAYGVTHSGQVQFVRREVRGCARPCAFAMLLPCDHDAFERQKRRMPAHVKGTKNWARKLMAVMGIVIVCLEPGCGRVHHTAMLDNLNRHVKHHAEAAAKAAAEAAGAAEAAAGSRPADEDEGAAVIDGEATSGAPEGAEHMPQAAAAARSERGPAARRASKRGRSGSTAPAPRRGRPRAASRAPSDAAPVSRRTRSAAASASSAGTR